MAGYGERLLMGLGVTENPHGDDIVKAMEEARQMYEAYSQQQAQDRMNAINSAFSMFGPANNMLGRMYGPQAMTDFDRALQNPLDRRPARRQRPPGELKLVG